MRGQDLVVRGGASLRCLCSEANTHVRNAYFLLGLKPEATKKAIKMRYYELAKQTHPDVLDGQRASAPPKSVAPVVKDARYGLLDEPDGPTEPIKFLELHAAFEVLMEALEAGPTSKKATSVERGRKQSQRARTLGEVLCDRVKDEPEAAAEVWAELMHAKLTVTGPMADLLFRACAKPRGGGLVVALEILSDGTYEGLISQDVRNSAIASLLGLCGTLDWDVDEVINHITDLDRESPEVLAALGSFFCEGTRSPY